ncbi:nectin-4-like isoform X2 [Carassius auratus]|uniref:Nectin-4-like isoform X2 n=1 Tax=Carassius auratus TaxID=7957 RepID=A0A6P6R573_CARAU|nr:nectin-4-like isoform X2 [Carassius auratus]
MMDLHNVFIPLLLSCTSVFTVLYGQKVVTDPKVTVYQGNDVTLLCQYIRRSTEDKITQVRWTWQNQSSEYKIMVFHNDYGLHIHETPLKDRVSFSKSSPSIDEASIIIRDVKISDKGLYSCDITIYPGGSLTGQTTLIVLEDEPAELSLITQLRAPVTYNRMSQY